MATLLFVDGFEHGNNTSGVAGVYSSVTAGTTIVTSPVRTGLRALEVSAAGASEGVQYTVASTFVATAFYVRFATLPGATVKLIRLLNANGSGYIRFNSGSGKLTIQAGAGSAVTLEPSISTNTWYRVVAEYDTSTGTANLRARVDTSTEGSSTNVQTSANVTGVQLGPDDAVTYTGYFDDWVISVTDGDYEEIRDWTSHSVQSLIPSADGTHNIAVLGDFDSNSGTAFDNSTTNGYTFIAHRPLQLANTANQVIRQDVSGTTRYMELTFENLSAGDSTVEDVRTYASHIEASNTGTSLNQMQLMLSDSTEVLTTGSVSMIETSDDPGITLNLRKRMAIPPAGGWDTTKVNGLKVRLGFSDAAPIPNFIDCMVEVALFTPGAVSTSLAFKPPYRRFMPLAVR